MTGMNASVSAGWYTFTNLGPVTTTFTPPPGCTGSNQIGLGYVNPTGGNVVVEFATECTSTFNSWSECVPTTTSAPSTAAPSFTGTTEEECLYCPSGWQTVGMVARDNSGSLTSSGILAPTETTTTQKYSTDDLYYEIFNYEKPATVMKEILEPKQTMALCCPSGMTADTQRVCYSIVREYTPTFGCQIATGYSYKYFESGDTYSNGTDSPIRTVHFAEATATIYITDTYTTTLDCKQTYYSGLIYAPAVTLLHHESDLSPATGSPTADSSIDSATPSSAAGRLPARTPVWDGIGTIIGISVVAMALGAAMILPW